MMDRFLENDTVLKVVSLLVALFLWFEVVPTQNQNTVKSVGPVAVQWTIPSQSNWTVMSVQPNAVTVQIKGPPQVMSGIGSRDVEAVVNISNLTRPGSYSLRVAVSVPRNTSLVSVVPAEVVVTVDKIGTQKMAIELKQQGSPAAGYEVGTLNLSRTTASVTGPSQELAKVHALVGEVPLNGRQGDFSEQIMVLPENAHGQIVPHVEVNPPLVTVDGTIVPKPPQKTVHVVAQLSGHPASGYQVGAIYVHPSEVTVIGTSQTLSGLTTINTEPVNVTGYSGTISESVPLQFPKGVSSTGVTQVTVTITIVPTG